MRHSKADITSAQTLLAHMLHAQAAFLAGGAIQKRRVRLVGVQGWYWLVVRLAYSAVGKAAITVPSANSVRDRIDGDFPTGGVRMVRFGVPAVDYLQADVADQALAIEAEQRRRGDAGFYAQFIVSTEGLSIRGTEELPEIAFRYPSRTTAGFFVYGLVLNGEALFVLSFRELPGAAADADAANDLFAQLRANAIKIRLARTFEEEEIDGRQAIQEFMLSAMPLPVSN